MKIKILKKLVGISGLLFMTFPAWSAIPSTLLPSNDDWNPKPVFVDVENPIFEGNMILAKGGGSGQGGHGNGTGDGTCDGDGPGPGPGPDNGPGPESSANR